jgi:GntR family transcriptional regulator
MLELQSIFTEKQRAALGADAPTPLYFQLYNLLKSCIVNGTLPHGARLPAEKDLSREFGVSRITVRRSLDELAKEGLVTRHRGRGTHVVYRFEPAPIQAPMVGMLQEIETIGRNSTARVLDCEMLHPPQRVRDALGLDASDKALYLARVRDRDGVPFGYYESWTVGVALPTNLDDFTHTPRMSYFRQHGLRVRFLQQVLSAEGASPKVAAALGVEPGAPLLTLTRIAFRNRDATDRATDFLKVYYHPGRFEYRIDVELED